jgi:hypothetical protein
LCWAGGLVIGALGVYTHQLWLMWLGSGVIGGDGEGERRHAMGLTIARPGREMPQGRAKGRTNWRGRGMRRCALGRAA